MSPISWPRPSAVSTPGSRHVPLEKTDAARLLTEFVLLAFRIEATDVPL